MPQPSPDLLRPPDIRRHRVPRDMHIPQIPLALVDLYRAQPIPLSLLIPQHAVRQRPGLLPPRGVNHGAPVRRGNGGAAGGVGQLGEDDVRVRVRAGGRAGKGEVWA